jgi:hypothetical protein
VLRSDDVDSMRDSPLRAPPLDPHRYSGGAPSSSPRRSRPFSPTNHQNNNNSSVVGSSDPWKVPVTATPLWDTAARQSPRRTASPARGQQTRVPPSPEARPIRTNNSFGAGTKALSRGRLMEGPSNGNAGWDPKNSNPWVANAPKDDTVDWFVPNAMSSMTGNTAAIPAVPVSSPTKWGQRVDNTDDFEVSTDWRFGGSNDSGEHSLYDDSGALVSREAASVLGSPNRPILAAEDGSQSRPIAIHDADLLDEREKDVLQQAARKKLPVSISLVEASDMRDQDVLQQAAAKRQQDRAAQSVLPNSFSASTSDARSKNKSKGIMGFLRGGVRSKYDSVLSIASDVPLTN